MEPLPPQISALNQQVYQRLESALSLNLRRQIWFAICDDLTLRNQLANALHTRLNRAALAGQDQGYPKLVTLDLDLTDPHFTAQVSQWLLQYPPTHYQAEIPGFQIIGIERLTRQPAIVQRLFLSYLQNIERCLPSLEASVLLWVSRPWCYSIQQSAPEFWQWRTGVFEFVGEPTATGTAATGLHQPDADVEAVPAVPPPPPNPTPVAATVTPIAVPPVAVEPAANLWDILNQDLAKLDQAQSGAIAMDMTLDNSMALLLGPDSPDAVATTPETTSVVPAPQASPPVLSQPASVTGSSATPAKQAQQQLSVTTDDDALNSLLQRVAQPATDVATTGLSNNILSHPLFNPVARTTPPRPNTELSPTDEPTGEVTQIQSQSNTQAVPTVGSEATVVTELVTNPAADPIRPTVPPSAPNPATATDAAHTERAATPTQPQSSQQPTHAPTPVSPQPPPTNPTQAHLHTDLHTQQPQRFTQPRPTPGSEVELRPVAQPEKQTVITPQSAPALDASTMPSPHTAFPQEVEQSATNNPSDFGQLAAQALLDELNRLVLATLPADVQRWAKQGRMVLGHGTEGQASPTQTAAYAGSAIGVLARPTTAIAAPPSVDEAVIQPVLLLRQLQENHSQTVPPVALVNGYLALGNFYRHSIEQGNATIDGLKIAILTYEQAAYWLGQAIADESDGALASLAPGFWSDLFNDLGNFYWMLSRCIASLDESVPALENAIRSYHHALHYLLPDPSHPDQVVNSGSYAMIQNNLGGAYSDLARTHAPVENLQQSIRAHQEALRYRPAQTDPLKYAATQNNLGTAFWNLAQHDQSKLNLQQAIAAYTEALKYYDPHQEPVSFAMMQNNLGTAYWNLAQYEPAAAEELLCLAINAYQAALHYRTVDLFPTAHAATQNNLGTAYWHLANQPKLEPELKQRCLQRAIAAYDAALATVQKLKQAGQPLTLNFDRFATHNNLGLAHYQFATDSSLPPDADSQMRHLQAALSQHLLALQGWQHQPEFYDTALGYVVQVVRACFQSGGLQGQNQALSRLPATLLPEVMRRL